MRSVKKEIRIVGFDDGPFVPRTKGKVPVIGVVFRGGDYSDGAFKTEVSIDGMDATKALIKLLDKSRHKEQLRVIMLKGISFGGFNMIDISSLYDKTKLPVIVVNRRKPNLEKIKKALKHFKDFKQRWECVEHAGKIHGMKIEKNKNIYYQFKGLSKEEVEKIIKLSCTRSLIPEPLRIAHLIASALIKGESGGRA
ncbi:MAG: DUF99 family protein [Candidatus Wukongarchaeota archaeon]|nr:DUF99 family protein [Candidatus Wukongarchaeota archaeon]